MARPYSYDLRQKAVEAVLNGAKLVEVSELFGMSIRTVQRWLKMWSESGDYLPKQNYQKGHSAKIIDWEGFRQFVEANPGLTQKEMGVLLGVSVIQTLVKPLKKSTLPVKKTYSYEEQNEEERQQFIKMIKEEKNED
jgi:transposase